MTSESPGNGSSTLRILGITSGLGCSVAFILIASIGGGILLDRRLDSSPVWTLIGVGIGIVAVVIEMATIVRMSRARSASAAWPRSSRPPDPEDERDDD